VYAHVNTGKTKKNAGDTLELWHSCVSFLVGILNIGLSKHVFNIYLKYLENFFKTRKQLKFEKMKIVFWASGNKDPDQKKVPLFLKKGDFWCQTQKSCLLVTIMSIRHTNTSNEG